MADWRLLNNVRYRLEKGNYNNKNLRRWFSLLRTITTDDTNVDDDRRKTMAEITLIEVMNVASHHLKSRRVLLDRLGDVQEPSEWPDDDYDLDIPIVVI